METSFCSICNRQFKSGGSFRIHKYRYHRQKPITMPIIGEKRIEEPIERIVEEKQPEPDEYSDEEAEIVKEKSDSDFGWVLGIGGAILAAILLLIFGREGGDNP